MFVTSWKVRSVLLSYLSSPLRKTNSSFQKVFSALRARLAGWHSLRLLTPGAERRISSETHPKNKWRKRQLHLVEVYRLHTKMYTAIRCWSSPTVATCRSSDTHDQPKYCCYLPICVSSTSLSLCLSVIVIYGLNVPGRFWFKLCFWNLGAFTYST